MKAVFTLLLVLLFVFEAGSTYSADLTSLSKKAAQLQMYMSRVETVRLLGKPTWAVIPSDVGEFALPDPRIKLELYWNNPGCTPVVVQFNSAYKVTGWDQGRFYCGKDAHLFGPKGEYSCKLSDRSKLCK